MSIISILDDMHSFFVTLLAGEKIDVLFPGTFFGFAILMITAFWIVFGKLKNNNSIKTLLIIIGNYIYIYYFTLKHFPLEFLNSDIEIIKREGMLFGQFWYPFYQMDNLLSILNIYLSDFIFLLAFGFVFAICFKPLNKFWKFLIFDVSVIIFEILFVLINNICHRGLCDTYDLSLIVIEIPAMLIGYILAKIIIKLNLNLYHKFQVKKISTRTEASIL